MLTRAKRSNTRVTVRLLSSEHSGTTYWTTKSKRNTPQRLQLRKYDGRLRRHVLFLEAR
jgi:large subunit ribosomal protein L33